MKTELFQSCGHCWVFQICWHIECSTSTASWWQGTGKDAYVYMYGWMPSHFNWNYYVVNRLYLNIKWKVFLKNEVRISISCQPHKTVTMLLRDQQHSASHQSNSSTSQRPGPIRPTGMPVLPCPDPCGCIIHPPSSAGFWLVPLETPALVSSSTFSAALHHQASRGPASTLRPHWTNTPTCPLQPWFLLVRILRSPHGPICFLAFQHLHKKFPT